MRFRGVRIAGSALRRKEKCQHAEINYRHLHAYMYAPFALSGHDQQTAHRDSKAEGRCTRLCRPEIHTVEARTSQGNELHTLLAVPHEVLSVRHMYFKGQHREVSQSSRTFSPWGRGSRF